MRDGTRVDERRFHKRVADFSLQPPQMPNITVGDGAGELRLNREYTPLIRHRFAAGTQARARLCDTLEPTANRLTEQGQRDHGHPVLPTKRLWSGVDNGLVYQSRAKALLEIMKMPDIAIVGSSLTSNANTLPSSRSPIRPTSWSPPRVRKRKALDSHACADARTVSVARDSTS